MPPSADDAGRAAHVELHLVHRGRRLDRDPSRVERDPLSHEHDGGVGARGALVLQDDEPRRFTAPARHREQRAHAQALHPGFVERLERDLFVPGGESLGPVCEVTGGADVAGEVAEVARQSNARGDRLSGLDAGRRRCALTARRGNRRSLGRRNPLLAGVAAHRVESIDCVAHSFDRNPRAPLEIPIVDLDLAERPGHASGAGAARRAGRVARDLQESRRGHRLLLRPHARRRANAVRGHAVERVTWRWVPAIAPRNRALRAIASSLRRSRHRGAW